MYSREFCCYIYLKDNYLILTQLQINFQKRNTTVGNFIKQNIKYLENVKMYQYIYATLYPKFYLRYTKFGAENWSIFELCYGEWINNRKNYETGVSNNQKTSIKQVEISKNPENYKRRSASTVNEFEQVPIADKYKFVRKKTPQKTIRSTAKELMDHKNHLKRKNIEQKKTNVRKKIRTEHFENEQIW